MWVVNAQLCRTMIARRKYHKLSRRKAHLIHEIVHLRSDLFSSLSRVKLLVLQHRGIIFLEAEGSLLSKKLVIEAPGRKQEAHTRTHVPLFF